MDLEIVLNELSLKKQANDIQTARGLMSGLINTLREVESAENVKITLVYQRNLLSVSLAPDYPLRRCINDRSLDEKERRLLIALMTKGPYLEDTNASHSEEFLYQKNPAFGLGYAFQHNDLAISLKSDACWDNPFLELEHIQIDDEGELVSDLVEVFHISSSEHVVVHSHWIKNHVQLKIQDWDTLWTIKQDIFPHLQFCDSVEKQLQNLQTDLLELVKNKLFELEHICGDWQRQGGAFDHHWVPGPGGPDSDTTLNKFRQDRLFRCPDGENRLFSLHTRIRIAFRLHYFPLNDKKLIIVGYVGRHLPTATDPT